MRLFDPERHEALAGAEWDQGAAGAAIGRIVADTEAAYSEAGLWPIHPLDRSAERPPDCLKPLYHGAAGVVWALGRLAGPGGSRDFHEVVSGLIDRSRDDLRKYDGVRQYMDQERPAFLIGDAGILLLGWTMAGSDELEARLHEAIAARIGDSRGLVWGGAGAMLAALFMHERTGAARWKALWLEHAEALLAAWTWRDDVGCPMHAIGQADRAAAEHGQRKFSVWTGDLGLALYLCDCVAGSSDFPMLDVF